MSKPDDKTTVSPPPKAMVAETTAPLERTVIVAPIADEPTQERVETTLKVENPFASEPGWEAERAVHEPPPEVPPVRTVEGASKWRGKASPEPARPAPRPEPSRVSARAPEPLRSPPLPPRAVEHAHEFSQARDAWESAWRSTVRLLLALWQRVWRVLLTHGAPLWRRGMNAIEHVLKKVEAHAENLEQRTTDAAHKATADARPRTMDVEAKSGDTADRQRAKQWNDFRKGKTSSYLQDDDESKS